MLCAPGRRDSLMLRHVAYSSRETDRHIDQEYRPPAEELGNDTAGYWSGCESDAGTCAPDCEGFGPFGAIIVVRNDGHRRGQEEGGTGSL